MSKKNKANIFLLQKTKQFILKKFNVLPQFAIIAGSGVEIFPKYNPLSAIKYNDLPIWSNQKRQKEKIKGHESILKLFKVKNKYILVFSGRKHLYQGASIFEVIMNVRLSYDLGIQKILITNAAGGINEELKNSDLMLISGYLDFMQGTERGVLSSITQPPLIIKTNLTKLLHNKFKRQLKVGVYTAMLGPSYETYSEIRFFQSLGADAVGMSTVPEIICAKGLQMDYAGISIISNTWNSNHIPSHLQVLASVKKANKKLNTLILKVLDHV